ncbi:MAG: hypothetical protein COB33_002115 [Thiotrichaceae bacterium]|nr:hypothetical protein [Thiotrichaceae bacterium]
MKILFLIPLMFFSVYLHAEPLIVSSTQLEIDNQCRLKATNKAGESKLIELSLPESSDCKFVIHYKSNVIHLRLIGNSNMFFVELPTGSGDECKTKYVAVAIQNNGTIVTSATYARSGVCPPNLETKAFHSFAYEMKIIN